jgi:hypothetical protein|tara:strand:+ start:37646 stop:37921 length:276 start_codon:yes stop_codon:yes gene_type:complete
VKAHINFALLKVQKYLETCLPGKKIYVAARISPNASGCSYHVVIDNNRGGEAYESWADFSDLIDQVLFEYGITRVDAYLLTKPNQAMQVSQ